MSDPTHSSYSRKEGAVRIRASVRSVIRGIAQEHLESEMRDLVKSGDLMNPAKSITPQDCRDFSWGDYMNIYAKKCPLLVCLLRGVVFPRETGEKECEDLDIGDDDGVDKDEGQNVGGREPGMRLRDLDLDPNNCTKFIGPNNIRKFKNRDLIMSSAISVLGFARSQKVNSFQTYMSMYLEVSHIE